MKVLLVGKDGGRGVSVSPNTLALFFAYQNAVRLFSVYILIKHCFTNSDSAKSKKHTSRILHDDLLICMRLLCLTYHFGICRNVKKMFYEDVVTYYGLTVYDGAVLGLFGAPLDYIYRTLEIEYKLVTPSYDVLFEKQYTAKSKTHIGFYTMHFAFEYDNLLKRINLNLVRDLKENIGNIKKGLSKKAKK